jgi:hypothetical protein
MAIRDPVDTLRDAVRVTAVVACAIVLTKAAEPHMKRSDNDGLAKAMLTQSVKWLSHSIQDNNTSTSLQNATYAVAYLNAARDVASDAVLERLSGLDIHRLSRSIGAQQNSKTKEMNKQCPRLRTKMPVGNGWLT